MGVVSWCSQMYFNEQNWFEKMRKRFMWAGLTTVVLDGDLVGRKLKLTAHTNKQRAAPPV